MTHILYGVSGEGSGHSSRAKAIIEHLESRGHKVKVITHSRGYRNLSKYFDVTKIFGLRLMYEKNEVNYVSTALRNLAKLPEAAASIDKVQKIIDRFKPQIIFSDFEPISCLVASLRELPLISIDNQHRLTNTAITYPKKYEQAAATAKLITNLMIYNSKACLVTTFFKSKTTNDKTFLFPPILREEVMSLKTQSKDYVLVYTTSKAKELVKELKGIQQKFIVYGFNSSKKDKNLIFKKPNQRSFLKDLGSCSAVIANAGFTLMTEALYLKKPYLAIPVKGQFEQVLNAYYLDKLGYGKYWDSLDRKKIEYFLTNLNTYSQKLKKYKPHSNEKIFKKIDQLIEKYA